MRDGDTMHPLGLLRTAQAAKGLQNLAATTAMVQACEEIVA
jgi:hypothetical protein